MIKIHHAITAAFTSISPCPPDLSDTACSNHYFANLGIIRKIADRRLALIIVK
ncbi:MAG: hypothetical protein LBL64_06425 [Treponema sp.]|nr:hypothetical protein [Treponema sp.]